MSRRQAKLEMRRKATDILFIDIDLSRQGHLQILLLLKNKLYGYSYLYSRIVFV